MSEADLKAQTQEVEAVTDPALKQMMEAGVFYGRTKNKTNPKMKQFILANRNGVEIINLEKTKDQLASAMEFVKSAAGRGASMIVVATQPSAHAAVAALGKEFNLPIVLRRWLGGTLTNYRVIAKRVEYFKKLKTDLATGAFRGYTKKEQLDLEKEAEKLTETLAGLENMNARPEVLIVVDPIVHKTGVREANRLKIPVVALVNTDTDPAEINYPVIGNTKARTAVEWFITEIAEAIREGKAAAATKAMAAEREAAAKKTEAVKEEKTT